MENIVVTVRKSIAAKRTTKRAHAQASKSARWVVSATTNIRQCGRRDCPERHQLKFIRHTYTD